MSHSEQTDPFWHIFGKHWYVLFKFVFFYFIKLLFFLLGLIAQISETFYDFLLKLQKNLTNVIKSVGKIDYDYWRNFSSEKKTEKCTNFIDGDIIESFLDLSRNKMAECIQGLTVIFLFYVLFLKILF